MNFMYKNKFSVSKSIGLCLIVSVFSFQTVIAQNGPSQIKVIGSRADVFVDSLMNLMTIQEKIGQLNLPSVGFDVTGPVVSQGVDEKLSKGLVGGVFNTFTPVAVRKLQEKAIKGHRLHIPLLFGYDVIHGHRTIFPIPLALSCTWNLGKIEDMARISAKRLLPMD